MQLNQFIENDIWKQWLKFFCNCLQTLILFCCELCWNLCLHIFYVYLYSIFSCLATTLINTPTDLFLCSLFTHLRVCVKQKSSKSSILKPAGTKLSAQSSSTAASEASANSRKTVTRPDGKTSRTAVSRDQKKQTSNDNWDWDNQWWRRCV